MFIDIDSFSMKKKMVIFSVNRFLNRLSECEIPELMVSKYLFMGTVLQNHSTKETNNSAYLNSRNSSLESYNKNEFLLERKSCIANRLWG